MEIERWKLTRSQYHVIALFQAVFLFVSDALTIFPYMYLHKVDTKFQSWQLLIQGSNLLQISPAWADRCHFGWRRVKKLALYFIFHLTVGTIDSYCNYLFLQTEIQNNTRSWQKVDKINGMSSYTICWQRWNISIFFPTISEAALTFLRVF